MAKEDTFERARRLLMGAVDTVIEIASKEKGKDQKTVGPPSASSSSASASTSASSARSLPKSVPNPVLSEHSRLFGFKPSKAGSNKYSKGKRPLARKPKVPGKSTWRRDCVFLRERVTRHGSHHLKIKCSLQKWDLA